MSADRIDFSAKTDRELLIITAQSVNEMSEDVRLLCTRVDALECSRGLLESEIKRVENSQVLCRQEIRGDMKTLQLASKSQHTISETILKYTIPLGIAIGGGAVVAIVNRLG